MKKVLLCFSAILMSLITYAQTFPVSRYQGTPKELLSLTTTAIPGDVGGIRAYHISPQFVDTTAANLHPYYKYTENGQIIIDSTIWIRKQNRWVSLGNEIRTWVGNGLSTNTHGDSLFWGNSPLIRNTLIRSAGFSVNISGTGDQSTVLGYTAQATGSSSAAFGDNAQATANYAYALGPNSLASAVRSLALGNMTDATGIGSTALGDNAQANCDTCTAIGKDSQILTKYGIALGDSTHGGVVIGGTVLLPTAKFQVNSTTKGFLIPRMTTTQRDAIVSPALSLQIYNITTVQYEFWNGSAWVPVLNGNTGWALGGNQLITGNEFIGTLNDAALLFRSGNHNSGQIDPNDGNTAFGSFALRHPLIGITNTTAIGANTLTVASGSTSGNTAVGWTALTGNTSGNNNTGIGGGALSTNTIGTLNTALGFGANVLSNNLMNASAIGSGAFIGLSNAISIGDTTQSTRVGIGTAYPNESALLDIKSTTNGMLVPRMNTTQMNAISSPATSLLIYNTDSTGFCYYTGSTWIKLGTGGGGGTNYWTLDGGTGELASDVNGTKIYVGNPSLGNEARLTIDNQGSGVDTLMITQDHLLRLAPNDFKIRLGGVDLFSIDGSTGTVTSDIQGGEFNIKSSTYANGLVNITAGGSITLGDVVGDVNGTQIALGDVSASIVYNANNGHSFTGKLLINTVASGSSTDSILIRDPASGEVKARFQGLKLTTTASSATPTPVVDGQWNMLTVTALAANATIAAPTGTFTDGQSITIRIEDNGVARTLAWNAIYRAGDIPLPTTTVAGKVMYMNCLYHAGDSKLDLVGLTGNF